MTRCTRPKQLQLPLRPHHRVALHVLDKLSGEQGTKLGVGRPELLQVAQRTRGQLAHPGRLRGVDVPPHQDVHRVLAGGGRGAGAVG